jgi:hypothetical protein
MPLALMPRMIDSGSIEAGTGVGVHLARRFGAGDLTVVRSTWLNHWSGPASVEYGWRGVGLAPECIWGRGGMGSQLAIEQSKGARTLGCSGLVVDKDTEMPGQAPFNAGDGGHVC